MARDVKDAFACCLPMTLSLLARIGSELDEVRIPYALIGAAALAPDISTALGRATRVSVGDMAILVVGVADLILLKLYAGGAQDLWDVEQLLAVNGSRQVTDEVERGLIELPSRCADLWARRQNN